jgi:hypothetical protein
MRECLPGDDGVMGVGRRCGDELVPRAPKYAYCMPAGTGL